MPTRPAVQTRQALGEETRASLIAAATEIFLRDGFRAARVQEIARAAGQRLSAINYHFESKEGLYLAVMRHHAELAIATSPLIAAGSTASQRERFDHAIHAFAERMIGGRSGSRIGALMLRELVNPTAALDALFERFGRPQSGLMRTLLAEILGPAVPQRVVGQAMFSVFGQCIAYVTARPLVDRLLPDLVEGDDVVERVARHVAEFSWAGLQALRAQWENKE